MPSQNGVEDIPTIVGQWVTAVDMPNRFGNVICTRPEPFSAASPPVFIVLITLKEPDTSGEQTSSDQVQDTSGDDQEDLHRHIGTKVVQQGTHCKTTNYTNDNWDWER